jgi:hypothetical protein
VEERKSDCICAEVSAILRKLGPSDEVMSHFRAARVEMLKGIRQMIDERIEDLNKTTNKGTHVVVE